MILFCDSVGSHDFIFLKVQEIASSVVGAGLNDIRRPGLNLLIVVASGSETVSL